MELRTQSFHQLHPETFPQFLQLVVLKTAERRQSDGSSCCSVISISESAPKPSVGSSASLKEAKARTSAAQQTWLQAAKSALNSQYLFSNYTSNTFRRETPVRTRKEARASTPHSHTAVLHEVENN